jgi:hypothetical protein
MVDVPFAGFPRDTEAIVEGNADWLSTTIIGQALSGAYFAITAIAVWVVSRTIQPSLN